MPTPHADLTRLMNALRMRLPGALDPAIRYELFAVCDELFTRSDIWQEAIPFTTTVGETFYEIEPEMTNSKIVRLIRVENDAETPISATMANIGEVTLAFEPSVEADYTAFCSITVKDPTDSNDYPRFPVWILERYREGLFDGVMGRMMSQPMKPYANERMSIYHLRRFRNVMAQATKDAQHTHVRGANAWIYPRGWR